MQSCFSLLFSTKHTRKHRKHTHTLDVEFFLFFLFWKAEHDAGLFCFIFVQGKRFPECFCLSISTSFVIRPARLTVGTLAPCYMVTSGDFLCSWWPCFWPIVLLVSPEQIHTWLISVVLVRGGFELGNLLHPQANGGSK